MQRQLEKITELLRLIVQKMEISTEIVIDDRSKCDKNDACIKVQKLRQTFNVVRRFSRLTPKDNVSHNI